MDLLIEILKRGEPFFLLTILIAIFLKGYMIAKMKHFDLAEVFFSIFRIYNSDEIHMSSNRKRISFMRWNNLLNYYIYSMTALVILIYVITKNL
jgi:hypothetical protein